MEFQKLLTFKASLKPATLKSYEAVYNRLIDSGLFTFQINETAQDKIIKIINQIDSKSSSRLNLLNVAIVLKQAHDKPVDLLLSQRETYQKTNKIMTETSNEKLREELPSVKELKTYLLLLFTEQRWVEFIVNYLIININTRNSDLYLTITSNKKNDLNDNYLVIRSKDIQYVRNIYKTAEVYNQKKNVITDKQFNFAVKQLGERPLIQTKTGERIPIETIGTYIKRLTYNQLGEIQIFKAVVKEAGLNNIAKISKNRGTNADTILENYYTEAQEK